jgi:EmrB/QacA subfamily drug resistance transporter
MTVRRRELLVAGAYFMEILDSTVIAPAAPRIAADLGVAAVTVNVTITAYVLTLAVLIPVSGWLADRYGARPVFLVAMSLFTVASAGCAAATSLPMLVGTRVLQGVGGAMMVPVGRLLVLRSVPKAELAAAIAYLTWPALVAPVLAPALGGVLTTYWSWRLIFLVNVPIGVAGVLLARRLLPRLCISAGRSLDGRGFLLYAAGTAALIVGLEGAAAAPGSRHFALTGALVIAVVVLPLCVRHLLRARMPLLDLRILAVPTFRATARGGTAFRAVMGAVPFVLSLFFQVSFGWSAAHAGVVMTALFAGHVGIKPAATALMRRYGIRIIMAGSVLVAAGCLLAAVFVDQGLPPVVLAVLLVVIGMTRSTGQTSYNTLAFADVPDERMSSANTLMSTLQELGSGLGVAVAALVVGLARPLIGSNGAFRVALAALAAVLVLSFVEARRLPLDAGDVVTGRF